MDWIHEPYRKLYTRADAKWLRHSILARGLAALLLVATDEDGFIYLVDDETPADAVMRVLAGQRSERAMVKRFVTALLEARPDDPAYLMLDLDRRRFQVRNFPAAQGVIPGTVEDRSKARSAAAIRAAEWREANRSRERSPDVRERVREQDPNGSANSSANTSERVREQDPNAFASRAGGGARATPAPPGARARDSSSPSGSQREREPGLAPCSIPKADPEALMGRPKAFLDRLEASSNLFQVPRETLAGAAWQLDVEANHRPELDVEDLDPLLADAIDVAALALREHKLTTGESALIEVRRLFRFRLGYLSKRLKSQPRRTSEPGADTVTDRVKIL